MNEMFIFVGEGASANIRKLVDDFLANGKYAALGCHVADNLWAMKTSKDANTIFDALTKIVSDPSLKIVVAPLSGDWLEANCTSAMKCFRRDE